MPFPRAPSRRPFAHLAAESPAGPPQLTARQRQILDWIRMHIETAGMPPTRAEIAAGLGFSTASSAEDHLQALAKKGAIELKPGASRGLRLRDFPGLPVQGTLPLVGRVAAGQPILAAEHVEGRYKVDPALFSPVADFLLRVSGASMQDAGILDGDLLAVHKTAEARSGQIVVARLGDEVTVKRLKRRGREVALLPENAAFQPIVVDLATTPFAIEGVGVGLLRAGRGF
ncbi:MAG: transcriptional repressor LexA [Burkholderiales bacterium]|jgi:repressor LexA|nr:transcriptional repressor LexA [Burkholderiales bacterium]